MLLCEYIRIIKQKYIKRKTKDFIEEIVIYTHNKEVYKVVVRYYQGVENKLRKLGINYYLQILNDIPKIKLSDELITNHNKYENLTIIYSSRTQMSTVISGEERTDFTNSS